MCFFQCRVGPNRVGPWGLTQSFADMIKMLTKELITINNVDRFLFNLAPFIVIIASVISFSCLPFAKGLELIDFNVGAFFCDGCVFDGDCGDIACRVVK